MRGLVQSAAPPPVQRQNVSRRRRIAKAASNAMGETKMDKIEPPENEPGDLVLVLDFGSQYTQLICRRVREVGFYSQLLPSDVSMVRIRGTKAHRRGYDASCLSQDSLESRVSCAKRFPFPEKVVLASMGGKRRD